MGGMLDWLIPGKQAADAANRRANDLTNQQLQAMAQLDPARRQMLELVQRLYSGNIGGLPQWMQVPDVDEIMQSLRGASDVDTERMMQQIRAQTAGGLAARGFMGTGTASSTQGMENANIPLWQQQARATNRGNLAQTEQGMRTSNATYLQNLANSLFSSAAGSQPNYTPFIDMYNQQANQYGQMGGNFLKLIGGEIGKAAFGGSLPSGTTGSSEVNAAQTASHPNWGQRTGYGGGSSYTPQSPSIQWPNSWNPNWWKDWLENEAIEGWQRNMGPNR